jgi:four helix bundle protein
MDKSKENVIVKKTFDFAVEIVNFCKELDLVKQYILSKQLLRSGTSIGANVWEAQDAESKLDFIHKMKIALKETNETQYWLMIIQKTIQISSTDNLLNKLSEIHNILSKIVSTSKKKT